MRRKHVEVYRGADGWWRFRLVGGNGEKSTGSQAYRAHRNGVPNDNDSKQSAKRAARSAHPNVPLEVG